MKNSKLVSCGFLNALGILVYTSGVAWFMFNGKNIFGQVHSFIGPLAILLLFIISAAITSSLVFLSPIHLYINGSKSPAFRLLFYTIGWLVVFFGIILFLVLAFK